MKTIKNSIILNSHCVTMTTLALLIPFCFYDKIDLFDFFSFLCHSLLLLCVFINEHQVWIYLSTQMHSTKPLSNENLIDLDFIYSQKDFAFVLLSSTKFQFHKRQN